MLRFAKSSIIALILAALLPHSSACAIDFDQDGFDDFVLIEINPQGRLVWYAIDINDPVKRSVGAFGRVGDHLAVGDWLAARQSSMARIQQTSSGAFQWSVALPGNDRTIALGNYPDTVVSGFDADRNGTLDPAVVSRSGKNFNWKVLLNPGLTATPAYWEGNFGVRKEIPFFANLDGTGDNIATAKVSGRSVLTIRYKSLTTGKAKAINVKNFRSKISRVLPFALPAGKDGLYIISKKGKKHGVTVLIGKKKKTVKISGDEFVVGKYLGDGQEILLVRNNAAAGTFIDARGRRTPVGLDLSGILVDDININNFKQTDDSPGNPGNPPGNPNPPHGGGGRGSNPACSGTQTSTEHLLYKPVSDTSGNVVLVFDSTYGREFASVKLELRDGTFTDAWWKGLELWGNPDPGGLRQHWRTNVRASQVKDGALIIAQDTNQECRFVIPGASNRRWE